MYPGLYTALSSLGIDYFRNGLHQQFEATRTMCMLRVPILRIHVSFKSTLLQVALTKVEQLWHTLASGQANNMGVCSTDTTLEQEGR